MAPHAPYTVSDRTFGRILMLAEQLDLPIHLHVHETAHEIEESIAQHGVRPIERLRRLGLVGPSLIGVHAVHLVARRDRICSRATLAASCTARLRT